MDAIFALAVPPLTNPGTVVLPRIPAGPAISPGSIVISILAGVGAYLQTQTQPQPQPDPVESARKQLEQDAQDNKHVVKMLDVAKEVDNMLTNQLIMPLVWRTVVSLLRGRKGNELSQWTDLTGNISDEQFEPIRAELKRRIRAHILQQKNARKSVTEPIYLRLGKIHQK